MTIDFYPLKKNRSIEGYAKCNATSKHRMLKKSPASQPLEHRGQRLLIEDITQNVFVLEKNYHVKDERFQGILERLRVCKASTEQGQLLVNLCIGFQPPENRSRIENDPKTI